ncbi:MAG: hypothetical protein ACE5DN_01380 [Flavobacteriales bacterium]
MVIKGFGKWVIKGFGKWVIKVAKRDKMTEKESTYQGGFRELEVWKEARMFRKEISD